MVQENKTTASFSFKKETKNTFCYQEDGDDPIIGTVYVQKKVFPGDAPKKLKVSITTE